MLSMCMQQRRSWDYISTEKELMVSSVNSVTSAISWRYNFVRDVQLKIECTSDYNVLLESLTQSVRLHDIF